MEQFFIITNIAKDRELKMTEYICDFFRAHNKVCRYQVMDEKPLQIPVDAECILVLGGDGSLLQVARGTMHLDIPMIGINLGSLGFLAEVEKTNLNEALHSLLHQDIKLEERMMLTGTVNEGEREMFVDHALNDIVLARSGSLRILTYEIYVNGQYLNRYHADGVILATPTGSTAYNMSAGGPIVEPKANLLLVTPICPHTLNTRSIVLSAEDIVEVKIVTAKNGEEQQVEVNFDGNSKWILKTGDSVVISRSSKVAKFLRMSEAGFLEVLHKKMRENP